MKSDPWTRLLASFISNSFVYLFTQQIIIEQIMYKHFLGTGDSAENKADKVLDLMEIRFQGRVTDNMHK